MNEMVPIRPGDENKPKPQISPGGQIEKRKVNKVVEGKVTTRKPSIAKKAASAFLAEDINNVKSYIIFDVLIPAAKDMVISSVEMLLWGSTSNRRRGSYNGNVQRTDYSSYSYKPRTNGGDRRDRSDRGSMRDLDDIVLERRDAAEAVIGELESQIADYGRASVADLYDALGITGDFPSHKWGWKEGAEFGIQRVRDGYLLILPRIVVLDT